MLFMAGLLLRAGDVLRAGVLLGVSDFCTIRNSLFWPGKVL